LASSRPSLRRLDPAIRFADELPISARVRDLAAAIDAHQVVIVAGETGSGKTTQLPKLCLAMGRGREARIGVTQPRRLAATTVAARVASELGVTLGREVGYQIRFGNETSAATRVKFLTDGLLLAEIQGDPLLRAYDTLILDEAHERSLNIDFLLGYVKRILPRRPDLRVVISSATLATDRFSAFFDGAPVIEVSGRTYPVEVLYRPPPDSDRDLAESVAEMIEAITARDGRGDILVFLPGEREIHETAAELHAHALPHTLVLPLYSRLSQSEQTLIFQPSPQRRVVLATNVAETSLTIPGIVYVIDTGIARINRHDPRTGVTQLLVEPVSRASADQRKGRAGRTRSGVCFRLYSKRDFDARPAFTDPEVFRVGLANAILQMTALGLGAIESFPFLDPPPKRAIEEGHRVLEEIGALDGDRALTAVGAKLARFPVDPRIGRMILGGDREGVLAEVLVIASALGLQDPRERPVSAQRRADEAHERFRDESSDFMSLLKVWSFARDLLARGRSGEARRLCREHFLSHVRLQEWTDVHAQLSRLVREQGFAIEPAPSAPSAPSASSAPIASATTAAATGTGTGTLDAEKKTYDAIHRALLSGLLSRIGTWHPEQRTYLGARQTRFQLHPSSGLARKKAPPWIMIAELVETSQLFGRTAARIDPAWLEAAGGALCKRSFGEPNWAKSAAQVMNKEQVTLYGLPIVRDRKVHYGPIDARVSRRLFLVHALVRQEYAPPKPAAFMEHNRAVFSDVRRLCDRARKSDMLADDETIALFFERRLPDDVHSGATFEAWRAKAERDDPRLLYLAPSDVLLDGADEISAERFPDALTIDGATFALSYRFEPGEDDDGLTMTVPIAELLALDAEVMEWTIPGWHREKIAQLVQSLPRRVRDPLGDWSAVARALADATRPFDGPMLPALSRALESIAGVRVASDAWAIDELSPHLRLHIRVVEAGKTLGEGRDLRALQARFAGRAREAARAR
jgi:ATP-dependent helicase HrpA